MIAHPMRLDFFGPYGCTNDAPWPYFVNSLQAVLPGLYLWAVPVDGAYWINYIGKTDRDFVTRLRDEQIPLWLSEKDGCLDNEQLRLGRREDISVSQAALKETLHVCCLFLASCICDRPKRLTIEALLMHRVTMHGPAAKEFLSPSCRKATPTRLLDEPLDVSAPAGVTLVGLTP